MNNEKILKLSLLAGSIYFFCVALVHLLGLKLPILYIFYNIPSSQYQDQIISFLAFGWACFFFGASKILGMAIYLVVAGVVALLALGNIILNSDIILLAPDVSKIPFWIEVLALAIYTSWVAFFVFKTKAHQRS